MTFKRVLLKLSGEALASLVYQKDSFGINPDMLDKIAADIAAVHHNDVQVCVVVGGGNIYRGLQGTSKHKIDRTASDHMGMLATVINGLALHGAIESQGIACRLMSAIPMHTIAQTYVRQRAIRHLEKGRVVIFAAGTGNPYFTTDTAATLRAIEMNCDLLLKGTKVDGVYDKDPHQFNDATLLKELSYQYVVDQNIAVMDQTAVTLAQENKLPLRIFSLYHDKCFLNVIQGQGCFSTILPPS